MNPTNKNRICPLMIIIFISAMLGSADISLADSSIGYIKTAEKSAFIIRKGSSLTAKVGDSVFLKDVLKTDENGAIGITFLDNTMISIGADTE